MNRRRVLAGSMTALFLALLAGLGIVLTRPLPAAEVAPPASEPPAPSPLAAEEPPPAPIAAQPAAVALVGPAPVAEETPPAETPRELSLLDRLKSAEFG